MSKWETVKVISSDENNEKYYVDAWVSGYPEEEFTAIATIDIADGTVTYLDPDAKTDAMAQEYIRTFKETELGITE